MIAYRLTYRISGNTIEVPSTDEHASLASALRDAYLFNDSSEGAISIMRGNDTIYDTDALRAACERMKELMASGMSENDAAERIAKMDGHS